VAGGAFSLAILMRGEVEFVAATTLIFYGVALVNASKFMFSEIHWLGICEIVLGLLAAVFLHKGIWFWLAGFGVLHIIFGIIIFFNHDKI